MNSIQMTIALHYINETTDYNNGDFSDQLVTNTIQQLKDGGLLVAAPVGSTATLVGTEGLKMYADALSKIQLPKQIWLLQ